MRYPASLAFLACLFWCVAGQGQTFRSEKQPASATIRCGSLIDGVSANVRKNARIRIQGNRIVGIDNFQSAVPIQAASAELEYSADTCLPGLIDVHVHVITQDPQRREVNGAARESVSAGALKRTLEYGFTTVRNLGTKTLGPSDVDVRNAIEAGLLVGPRLQIAMISTDTRNLGATGAPMLRAAVDHLVDVGAQWIKLFASTGWDYAPVYDPTELAAIVDEAHKKGVKVAMHTVGPEDNHLGVQAGVDSIEHGINIEDADLVSMGQRGIVYVPTMSVLQFASKLPGQNSGVWTRQLNRSYSTFERALKAKVKIAFGTDAGALDGVYTANPAEQFQVMVEHGMTPMQAILSSIQQGAELMNMEDQIGTIQTGKLADIIAVEGDPLANISALQHVDFVMKNGQTVKSERN